MRKLSGLHNVARLDDDGHWYARTTAKRYRCKNERIPMCDRGDGTPPRKRCRYCGSEFYIEEGLYGVFDWRSDNLYDPAAAKSWHKTDDKASSVAEGEEVSRWVPASMLYPPD